MDGLMLTVITFHVIAFAMLSFIGFLAYKLGKVTIRGLVALGTKVGASPLVSLICFAIAVAMFPEPVTYVVNAVSNSSLFVFEEYLPRLNEIPSFETNDSVGPELLTRTTWITGYLLYALKGLITNLQLWRFPLVQTIFLLSTWLALAAAVTAAVRTIGDRVRAERTGADEVVKKVQSPTLKNVGLFALLGMGIYFSLTATAAIPSFKEAVIPAEFKSDKFKDWLNGLKLQDKELVAAFPDEGTLDDQSKLYWSSAKSTYLQEQDRLAKVYEALYQADYHRKGQGQTLEYHRDLTLDYLGRLGSMREVLSKCWVATHGKPADTKKVPNNLYDRSTSEGPQEDCWIERTDKKPPTRADLSAGDGPLALMMNWLLAGESLPLTLIVGLMGFGLLGATCSTFVRQAPLGQKGGAYVEDLTSVFIRGVSAAIVVFLAVYGGLAVFAAGEADPNPYAVLFAVLVAAVFSDDAWNWARSKFAAQMANRDQSGDQTRKPEGEPNAAKKEVQAAQTPPA